MPAHKQDISQRFWSKVSRSNSDDCWLWMRACQGFGYGLFQVEGRSIGAHRVAWQLAYGPIPDGLLVMHRCDNPRCVNPAHLQLGTYADNMADKARKGRCNAPTGDRAWARKHPERVPRGERHYAARLTAAQVAEIRARYAAGRISQQALADAYGVSRATITYIVNNKTWKA